MTTRKRLLLSGALLPLALALPLQCNKENPGSDGQDMGGIDPTADLSGTGTGDGGGGGGDGGGSTMDLMTTDLLLLGVTPATGPSTGMSGGSPVVLDVSGANFVAGMQVLIGGQMAVVDQVVSSSLIKVRLPAKLGTKGPVDVEVRHPDTRKVTRTDLFRYYYGNVALTLQGTKLDIGTRPWAISIADLNNNMNPDIVVVNRSSNDLVAVMGNGDGTFGTVPATPPKTSAMGGPNPTGLALGDMNKDGFLDAIACNESVPSVAVLLNNQAGVFSRNNEYSVGSTPQAVVGADLNGDMIFDALTANAGGNNASLLYGAAASAFTTPATMLTPGGAAQSPSSLALIDLNKDNKPDLVLVNQMTSNVSVFLWNDTTKAFEWKANYQTGANTNPRGVTVGDFIGDGNVDVAVSLGLAAPQILIMAGDGTGALGTGTLHPVSANNGDAPLGMASADFDGDGTPDIVTALSGSTGIALVLNRNKMPQPAIFISTGKNPQALAVGDLDKNGKPDVAVANTGDNQVAILLNTSQ